MDDDNMHGCTHEQWLEHQQWLEEHDVLEIIPEKYYVVKKKENGQCLLS